MWGASPNDVWFGGGSGVVAHWDGNGITATTLPTMDGFDVIVGTSANDVWALGGANDALSSIYHWDGTGWSAAVVPQTSGFVSGAYAASPDDIWSVGWFGAALHYDGTAWTPVGITESDLVGVSGTSASDVWMLGGDGAILHHP
jgi:hypothetical protein